MLYRLSYLPKERGLRRKTELVVAPGRSFVKAEPTKVLPFLLLRAPQEFFQPVEGIGRLLAGSLEGLLKGLNPLPELQIGTGPLKGHERDHQGREGNHKGEQGQSSPPLSLLRHGSSPFPPPTPRRDLDDVSPCEKIVEPSPARMKGDHEKACTEGEEGEEIADPS